MDKARFTIHNPQFLHGACKHVSEYCGSWIVRCVFISVFLFGTLPLALCQPHAAWWGLWNSGMGLTERSLADGGINHLYVRLTAQNSPLLVGGNVYGIRFWLPDKTDVTRMKVWLARSYAQGPVQTVASYEVPLAGVHDVAHDGAPTEVVWEEGCDILAAGNPYANILAGVTLESTTAQTFMTAAVTGPSGSCFCNGRDVSGDYGPLALQVMVAGPLLTDHAASIQQVHDEQIVLAGCAATVELPLVNEGVCPLLSVDYVVSIDGQPQPARRYELPVPLTEIGLTVNMPVSYQAPSSAEEHQLQVELAKVNETDNARLSSVELSLTALSRECHKRSVMEEFTGTWCHNCVRGIVGIERLEQMFGDNFIAIAMHSDDPMQVDAYRNSSFYRQELSVLGGLPSCAIDRLIDCDPYCGLNSYGDFMTDLLVGYALSQAAVADLEVNAELSGESLGKVCCDVCTSFAYSCADVHYSLLLVLTADSLTGQGQQWQQRNGYNDYKGDDADLLEFAGIGQYIKEISFNHVAIDIAGVDGGIPGSIKAPLDSQVPQWYTHTFDISQNALAQHRDKLHVVAMLIDTRSGRVVNAAKCDVAQGSSAIRSPLLPAGQKVADRFTLSGVRIDSSARPGISIERTAEGTYRKVWRIHRTALSF